MNDERIEVPADQVYVQLTRDELKGLMREAVHDALTQMGVDTREPLEMQKDMAHLRKWRTSVDSATNKGFLVVLGVLITGLMGATYLGLQQMFSAPPNP